MPGVLTTEPTFNHIKIKELHPTFGAEISGVDFSKPLSEKVFQEIYAAVTKYGVVVFRSTALKDEEHIAFSAKFGELDDVKPYIAAGRANRLRYDELFDVSNVELDGTVLDLESPRAQASKVCAYNSTKVDSMLTKILGKFHLSRRLELQSTKSELFPSSCSRTSTQGVWWRYCLLRYSYGI